MPPNTNLSGWVANRNYAICVEGCKKIPVRSVDLCSSCCPFPWSFEVDPDVQLYAGEISNPVVCWPKFQEQATKKTLAIPCTSATYDSRNAHPAVPESLHGTDGSKALSFVPASHSAPAVQLRSRVARHASMRDSEGNKAWNIVEPFGSGKPRWLLREAVLSYFFSEEHWNVNVGFKKKRQLMIQGISNSNSIWLSGRLMKTLCGQPPPTGVYYSGVDIREESQPSLWFEGTAPKRALEQLDRLLGVQHRQTFGWWQAAALGSTAMAKLCRIHHGFGAGNVWKKITNHH